MASDSTTRTTTRFWKFVRRPAGNEQATESTWSIDSQALTALEAGELLIVTLFVSVDPYLRIQMSTDNTWQAPASENEPQLSYAIGRVIQSTEPDAFPIGCCVRTYSGWTEYAKVNASDVQRIDQSTTDPLPLQHYLGALGMVGRTAWWGVENTLRPKPRETVVVTGAAGAVGSLVVQLCKKRGCRVVAVAGSDDKCRALRDELGADATLNYKCDAIDWNHIDALQAVCPDGIDCFWDNTGGYVSDAVFRLLNVHSRVAICGQISVYDSGLNADSPAMGPRLLYLLIYKRALVQGILQRDATPEVDALHQREAAAWIRDGSLHDRFTIIDGFDNIPTAFNKMMNGQNTGMYAWLVVACFDA
jgi:NADPH-dependent curcumin reductase CurA